jgi:hypothetical protein
MDLDPRIFFIVAIPDGDPKEATPTQGFAVSLIGMSWVIRAAAFLPTNIYDLTDRGREVLLARRMSGTERTDPFRSAVPIDPDQWFRLIPITDSG